MKEYKKEVKAVYITSIYGKNASLKSIHDLRNNQYLFLYLKEGKMYHYRVEILNKDSEKYSISRNSFDEFDVFFAEKTENGYALIGRYSTETGDCYIKRMDIDSDTINLIGECKGVKTYNLQIAPDNGIKYHNKIFMAGAVTKTTNFQLDNFVFVQCFDYDSGFFS